MRVLLVEDDPLLADATVRRLEAAGFVVDKARSLGEAIEAVMSTSYKVVLLDRRLADGDGLSLLPVIRTKSPAPPTIVLTALDDVPDRVQGLDAGAEDYLVKPFAFDELLARLRVLLRRGGQQSATTPVQLGGLQYDLGSRELRVRSRLTILPRRELALLDSLIRRAGRVVLRQHVEQDVYGFDDEVQPNALEAIVSRLRRRLGEEDAGVILQCVRGVGYLLRAN